MTLARLLPITLVLASAPAFAAPPEQPPVFGSDVALVQLPVFVSDREGRALRGLRAEDFELRDDGRCVRVVAFQYPAAAVEITSSLRDAAGAKLASGRLSIDSVQREAGGKRTYLLDYVPDQLALGDHTLSIGVGDAGQRLESYTLLRVTASRPASE